MSVESMDAGEPLHRAASGLRVLIVGFRWDAAGGLEAVTREVARSLGSAGATVEAWSVMEAARVETEGIAARGLAPAGGRALRSVNARWAWRPRLTWEVARAAARFDLVVAAHPWLLPPIQAGLPRGGARPRCWTWAYGIDVWGEPGRRLAPHLAAADRVVAISRYTRDAVAAWVRPERLSVVYPAVDTDFFTPGPASRGADLLIVGRLSRTAAHKGYGVLLRSLAPLAARLGRPATLRVVGDGDGRAALEREAAELGVADRVAFTGRLSLEALREEYRGCGAFAMPSRVDQRRRGLWSGEGLGLVYVEAQACGRPAIASTEGGAPEAVRSGETGLLADPRDPVAVAEAAAALLLDPETAARMGAEGRRFARDRFSLTGFRARLAGLLAADALSA